LVSWAKNQQEDGFIGIISVLLLAGFCKPAYSEPDMEEKTLLRPEGNKIEFE